MIVVTAAELVVGEPRRLLDLVPPVPRPAAGDVASRLRAALPELLAGHEERTIVVLASGDPLLAGIGALCLTCLVGERCEIHPAVSSVALARARMGWAAESVEAVRLRTEDDLDPSAAGCSRAGGSWSCPATPAPPPRSSGCWPTRATATARMTVLSDLGAPGRDPTALLGDMVPALNVVCVEVRGPGRYASLAAGLPDEAYEHDGQLTKRDLRRLGPGPPGAPARRAALGRRRRRRSIGIEWVRAHPRCRAIAVEQDPERVKRIAAQRRPARRARARGRARHGARGALTELPAAGRGLRRRRGRRLRSARRCWSALRPGGRLVVHAVTLETEA